MADSSRLSPQLEVAFFCKKTKGLSDKTIKAISGAYQTRKLISTQKYSDTFESFMTTNLKNAPKKDGTLKTLENSGLSDLTNNPTHNRSLLEACPDA